ncbi:MAG: glycoside hydrolase family 99-like domain-containing protein, partial [Pseudomonadota bacterium]
MMRPIFNRLLRGLRFLTPNPLTIYATWKIRRSGLFDRAFYRGCHPTLNAFFHYFPERHYVIFGEAAGFQPNPGFSPTAYRRLNEDLGHLRSPFLHYVRYGKAENRTTRQDPSAGALRGELLPPVLRRPAGSPEPAETAIVVHVYYPDLWDEMATTIDAAGIAHDLFVTFADQGPLTEDLPSRIEAAFPEARVIAMPNHGRDIFPFVHLVNSGLLAPYKAVCKIHTKKSPHRQDGDAWRRHLVAGLLCGDDTEELLNRFMADPTAGIWVADGQHYQGKRWWGSNLDGTTKLLNRVEIKVDEGALSFPAGSMYWMKPLMVAMIRGLQLDQDDFELETAQVDGTTAHAFERALGYIAAAGGLHIRQVSELTAPAASPSEEGLCVTPPGFVSAFYLPQFHRIPENDAWWGSGYTEWQAAAAARPQFENHAQPTLPSALGFYDLMRTGVMGEQAARARKAGIDAFCCYYYWFDGRTLLDGPLQKLLKTPDIDFPFYLCW